MIKLLLLLCVFLSLNAAQTVFDFPRQYDHFTNHFHDILTQNDHIIIVTPALNHSGVKKELLRHIKNGDSATLIVQSLKDDPLFLVQYKGIELHHYLKRPLNGTIIASDNSICFLTEPLDSQRLRSEKSLGWCSDDPETLFQSQSLIGTIKKHSSPYLK